MFEKGRIGIFGDSLTQLGENVNDLSKPMVWSQMLKLKHPEYEFIVDGLGGRRMWGNGVRMNDKIRDGSKQLEPFLSNSFPCKKIVIFLGTNDIFGKPDKNGSTLKDLKSFEEVLFKFKNLLFNNLKEIYGENIPKVFFITTHKFNFLNEAKFKKEEFVDFKDYKEINTIFKKLKDVEIIDVSNFEVDNVDGVHISLDQQKDFYKIIEKNII